MHECQNCHRDFDKRIMGFSCPYCGYVNDLRRGTTYVTSTDPSMPIMNERETLEEYLRRLGDVRNAIGTPRFTTDAVHRRRQRRLQAKLQRKNAGGGRAA